MSQRALWTAVLFLAIVSLVAAIPVVAEEGGGALDGRMFVVEVTDPSGDTTQDTLLFEDGLFRSLESEEHGFGPAPYSTEHEWDDGLEFSAVAESPGAGTRRWYGMLEGELVQGTFVWEKDGHDARNYIFEGAVAEP